MDPHYTSVDSENGVDAPPMSKSKRRMIALAVLVAVVGVIAIVNVVVFHDYSDRFASAQNGKSAEVHITATGFSPAVLNIAAGTTVTWTNDDESPHWIASDPFPTDGGLPDLNGRQALQQGDSYSYTYAKAGTFTYHDQLHPYNLKGSVVVR